MDNYNGKKILVILTGGTICSEYHGKVKSQGNTAGTVLEQSFRDSDSPFVGQVSFETTENYGIFSENMTVEAWNILIRKICALQGLKSTAAHRGSYPSLKRENEPGEYVFDGVIIAHGTDTLAYSASLFSILFRNLGVPVFLVSSNEALGSEKANGEENFRAAVECIVKGIKPNVYVTYKNPGDNRMYIHYASRLTQCRSYSEDFFSTGMKELTGDDVIEKIGLEVPDIRDDCPFDIFGGLKLKNRVLRIDPYVGLDYGFFDLDKAGCILHTTYHSGTVCTSWGRDGGPESASILSLKKRIGKKPLYIAPADIDGNIYETILSVSDDRDMDVHFMYGTTVEMLYVKLLLVYSGDDPGAYEDFLFGEYNMECITH